MSSNKDIKKIYLVDHLKRKVGNGEDPSFKSLFRENTNSDLTKSCVVEAIEEEAYIEVPLNTNIERHNEKIQRLFDVLINEIVKNRLLSKSNAMIDEAKDLFKNIEINKASMKEEEFNTFNEEAKALGKEAVEHRKTTAILIKLFEENKEDYIADGGEGWLGTEDNDEIIEIVKAIPEIKDQEDGIITVTEVIAKIDNLIDRITKSIEQIDMLTNGSTQDQEISKELDGVEAKTLDDTERIIKKEEQIDDALDKKRSEEKKEGKVNTKSKKEAKENASENLFDYEESLEIEDDTSTSPSM